MKTNFGILTIKLAEELHRQYRAAEKALSRVTGNRLLHDHGFEACSKQKYFVKRAALMLRRASGNELNETLGAAYASLDAQLLLVASKPMQGEPR